MKTEVIIYFSNTTLHNKLPYDIFQLMNSDIAVEIDVTNKLAQMKKGILEFAILLSIAKKPAYASDIIKDLKAADLIVVEGTLYPLLSRIKKAGLLDYSWVESLAGPPRKYYKLTTKGKQTLTQLEQSWQELVSSITTLKKQTKGTR